MRVLIIGGSGVIGRRAVAELVAGGHQVLVAVRDRARAELVASLGAAPVSLDVFDPADLLEAFRGVDALVNVATRIPSLERMRDRSAWSENDRLRATLTASIAELLPRAGVPRWIQESVQFVYADRGDDWIDESAPTAATGPIASAMSAEAATRRFARAGGTGVVLRFATLYGPDAPNTTAAAELMRKWRYPIIGRGRAFVSSIHTEDAGTAIRAALAVPTGAYNVADDRPLRSAELNQAIASVLGVRPPLRVPELVARLIAGEFVTMLATRSLRLSNRRLRETTEWAPRYPDAVSGWRAVAAEWSARASSSVQGA